MSRVVVPRDLHLEPDVAGHNTLACWHAGCDSGWCESASLERYCGCERCTLLKQKLFVVPPKPKPTWWV